METFCSDDDDEGVLYCTLRLKNEEEEEEEEEDRFVFLKSCRIRGVCRVQYCIVPICPEPR